MKEFIGNNWFKIIITLSVLLIGFSFFYYFVILGNQKEKRLQEENLLEKQRNCQEIASKVYDKWVKEESKESTASYNSEFKYNPNSNKCLLYKKIFLLSDNLWVTQQSIINVYTNEIELNMGYIYNSESEEKSFYGDDDVKTLEEFDKKKEELFSQ